MKRIFTLISLLVVANAGMAQEQVNVGDLLDLEERVLIKKMSDELNKPNPNAPPPAPVIAIPKAPKIVHPTQTLAVYGTNTAGYEGQLTHGGKLFTVRAGAPVDGYVVTSVRPEGIELSLTGKPGRRVKGKTPNPKKQTLFAPLVH